MDREHKGKRREGRQQMLIKDAQRKREKGVTNKEGKGMQLEGSKKVTNTQRTQRQKTQRKGTKGDDKGCTEEKRREGN